MAVLCKGSEEVGPVSIWPFLSSILSAKCLKNILKLTIIITIIITIIKKVRNI